VEDVILTKGGAVGYIASVSKICKLGSRGAAKKVGGKGEPFVVVEKERLLKYKYKL
jgi:hypothetical protein